MVDVTGNVVCCSADARRPVMGSAATSMNSGSSVHAEARGARMQAASQLSLIHISEPTRPY